MGIEIPISTKQKSTEKREVKRYRSRGDATVRRLESEHPQTGRILDLSARGCLLRLPDLTTFSVDTMVDMCINTGAISFRALGSVRHRNLNHWRIGISFVNLSRRGEVDLLELIDELEEAERAGRSGVVEISLSKYTGPLHHEQDPPDE